MVILKIRTIAVVAMLVLTGCGVTPAGQAAREAVEKYAATIADGELENLEWALCNAVSVGAVKRRYDGNSEKGKAYIAFCNAQATMPDIVQ
jgi:hypothetical protein